MRTYVSSLQNKQVIERGGQPLKDNQLLVTLMWRMRQSLFIYPFKFLVIYLILIKYFTRRASSIKREFEV